MPHMNALLLLVASLAIAGACARGPGSGAGADSAATADSGVAASSRPAGDSGPAQPRRFIAGNMLTSTALPAFTVRVDSSLRYAGRFPIRIEDIAGGERHIFIDTTGGRVERMLIFQFEGFLPGVHDQYRYPMRNPVTLGGRTYTHNTFVYSHAAAVREGPGREVDATLRYLRGMGLAVPDEQLMARFARILEDPRHEVLIFYQEAAESQGLTMARIADENGFRPEYRWVSDSMTARARRAFTVEEEGAAGRG